MCTGGNVSGRFHSCQNENDMNYKSSRCMKFLVLSLDEVYAGFHKIMSTSRELFE